MILGRKAKITVCSEIRNSNAIFSRVYQILVEATDELGNNAIITVTSHDKVPSGYVASGSGQILLECEETKVPDEGTMKQWLAQLALDHDVSLRERTRCRDLNESLIRIYTFLEGIAE